MYEHEQQTELQRSVPPQFSQAHYRGETLHGQGGKTQKLLEKIDP
jgi:hypothetical protein